VIVSSRRLVWLASWLRESVLPSLTSAGSVYCPDLAPWRHRRDQSQCPWQGSRRQLVIDHQATSVSPGKFGCDASSSRELKFYFDCKTGGNLFLTEDIQDLADCRGIGTIIGVLEETDVRSNYDCPIGDST